MIEQISFYQGFAIGAIFVLLLDTFKKPILNYLKKEK